MVSNAAGWFEGRAVRDGDGWCVEELWSTEGVGWCLIVRSGALLCLVVQDGALAGDS